MNRWKRAGCAGLATAALVLAGAGAASPADGRVVEPGLCALASAGPLGVEVRVRLGWCPTPTPTPAPTPTPTVPTPSPTPTPTQGPTPTARPTPSPTVAPTPSRPPAPRPRPTPSPSASPSRHTAQPARTRPPAPAVPPSARPAPDPAPSRVALPPAYHRPAGHQVRHHTSPVTATLLLTAPAVLAAATLRPRSRAGSRGRRRG
ncbi:hypothetical protein ACFFHI_29175 [Streptomyces palmae]|uniref:hypothetical protein n=1 Tax=Streptomyces palmae TaxID=1701085 RepID=UPI0035E91B88